MKLFLNLHSHLRKIARMSTSNGLSANGDKSKAKKDALHSSKTGWDGKLRLDKDRKAVLANPEALEDSDYSDEDAPPVAQIDADEGQTYRSIDL